MTLATGSSCCWWQLHCICSERALPDAAISCPTCSVDEYWRKERCMEFTRGFVARIWVRSIVWPCLFEISQNPGVSQSHPGLGWNREKMQKMFNCNSEKKLIWYFCIVLLNHQCKKWSKPLLFPLVSAVSLIFIQTFTNSVVHLLLY